MKLKKWFLGALVLGLATSCSDNDFASNGEKGQDDGGLTSTGYIAVEIKLPQETGATRAEGDNPGGQNDIYADGDPTEYAVENAMIVLFKGDKTKGERDANFYRAQDLKKPFFNNSPEDDNISSSYMAAIEVMTPPKENENLWALVIINRNGNSTKVNETDENGNTSVTIGNQKFTTANTFADVLKQITEFSFLEKSGEGDATVYRKFFMANAPLSNVRGGFDVADPTKLNQNAVSYLTNLGNQVYATPDEAKLHVSGCIYVERAVAKVTYQGGKLQDGAIQLKFHKMDADGNPVEYTNDEVKVEANVTYGLTNTNKTSYVVRNVEFDDTHHFSWGLNTAGANGSTYYRMVGNEPMPNLSTPFHTEKQNLFRTYWCLDPNYKEAMKDGKNIIDENKDFYSLNKPLYCKENTFNVQNQNYDNTTLAVFKVDLNIKLNGEDVDHLFIRNGDKSKIYLTKKDAGADEIARIAKDPNIQNAMAECLKEGHSTAAYSVTQHLDIVLEREYGSDGVTPLGNSLVVKEIKLKPFRNDKGEIIDEHFDEASIAKFAAKIGDASKEGTIHNDLLRTVNQLNEITEFAGAVSYYALPIKHFGDYYTPWNSDIKGTMTSEVYNGGADWRTPSAEHAAKYLGRYGVVRNNWYELNITKIVNLGAPSIDDIDMTVSDDNNEDKKYFAVEIHTLSWAKRIQKTEF